MSIQENMYMLQHARYMAPHCPDCGYFKMVETSHEYRMGLGGMSFYHCYNCGCETTSEALKA
jgi:hypothetical protein